MWLRRMLGWSLVNGPLPWTIWGVTAVTAVVLLGAMAVITARRVTRCDARRTPHPLVASLLCGVGLLAAWLASDVFVVFGVSAARSRPYPGSGIPACK